jgi:hypothetical protein
MKDRLAQALLMKVMSWDPERTAKERPELQALAALKYDEYQQFEPGMRFVERLALWLDQFPQDAREVAYRHVRRRLIFLSNLEMTHLVGMAFADLIRPVLLQKAAAAMSVPPFYVRRIAASAEFTAIQNSTLFLGLSDGARTDMFRRANPQLDNEQFLQHYEIVAERAAKLLDGLQSRLPRGHGDAKFGTVVLLDDFTASGLSYLRLGDTGWTGKIGRFHNFLNSESGARLIGNGPIDVLLVLYVATQRAVEYLEEKTAELSNDRARLKYRLLVGQLLPHSESLRPGEDEGLDALIEAFYDSSLEDAHTLVGGTNLKYGFAGCGLSTILTHNAPNNSLALLVGETDHFRALFPRVRRHAVHG